MVHYKDALYVAPPSGGNGSGLDPNDYLFGKIVQPVLRSMGYETEIAHHIGVPQTTLDEVMRRLINVDLVVFDLTGAEPNICFEAGIRHMSGRPVAHFISQGSMPPYDLAHTKPIVYDRKDAATHDAVKAQFIGLLTGIASDDDTSGRPLLRVLGGVVCIGDVVVTRDALREIEAFVAPWRANGTHAPWSRRRNGHALKNGRDGLINGFSR